MAIRKIVILVFCSLIMGAQFCVTFIPYGKIYRKISGEQWQLRDRPFWPIMRYTMYSHGKKHGSQFGFKELRVYIGNNDSPLVVTNYDLHLMGYRLNDLLKSCIIKNDSTFTPAESAFKDTQYLNSLILKHISQKVSRAEIWERTYTITNKGIENLNVPWILRLSWNVNEDLIKVISMDKKHQNRNYDEKSL